MPIETEHATREQSVSVVERRSDESDRRFANLRSVRWRVNLGILPSFSSSIDDLRRVTADSRRRYAALRRRLLTDPHAHKNRSNSLDFSIDNPLSQNPDSTWGRFFLSAELEKTVDQDLSRLYPEHESYFQATGCQGMLRRILLLWCLTHPECGYRQGMHELLAPFLYVLHIDVEYLLQIRKDYQEHFIDRFDGLSFGESDVAYSFDFKKGLDSMYDEIGSQVTAERGKSLEPGIQTLVMLTDAYGAEGELGIVLSEKFVEHDAYCMFDALMSGAHASVAMTDFFASSPEVESYSGLLPIVEASTALYQLLSIVDSSLHSHLVELGVEPQFFAIRWLRVLFGREYCLQKLLIVWDEIFSADSSQKLDTGDEANFKILNSPRGALIAGLAVSMILYLRSSLLAAENATSCLQRLLNYPKNLDLSKIIENANSLQVLAMNLDSDVCSSPSMNGSYHPSTPVPMRCNSLPSGSVSPKSPSVGPQSYWEEKWRVMYEAEEKQTRSSSGTESGRQTKKGWSRVKLGLFRTETEPLPSKSRNRIKEAVLASVTKSLLDDFSLQDGSDSEEGKANDNRLVSVEGCEVMKNEVNSEQGKEDRKTEFRKEFSSVAKQSLIRGTSDENSSIFSDQTSALSDPNNCHENDSKSSIGSNSFHDDNVDAQTASIDSHHLVSTVPSSESSEPKSEKNDDAKEPAAVSKEWKLLPEKFKWFWKFGHNEASDKVPNVLETAKFTDDGSSKSSSTCSSVVDPPQISDSKGNKDQNTLCSLRNLGHSMLEHIQVIESVFQQEQCPAGLSENFSKTGLVEKGQATAMTALKELRKISNLLSEV